MFSLMANCFSWIKWKREPIKKVTILMVGLDNAGKTSTVADLKGEALDGITPTVGFLSSNFNMYRFNVTVYDLGGGAKIRGIWKDYYAEVFGVVFVVDASNRERMDECRSILHETKQNPRVSGKPLLILANKQDLEGAMNDDEVYQSLDLGALIAKHKCPCQVYTCSAYIGQGNKIDKQIKKGFQWLLSEVSSNFASISLRVEKDIAEKKRIDAAEKKAKLERVRKARAEREREEQEAAERAKRMEEESDDDVVIGCGKKTSKRSTPSPDPSTPEKTKKRKKKKKVKKEFSLDAVDGNSSPVRDTVASSTEAVSMNGLYNRLQLLEGPDNRAGRLAPITNSPELSNTAEDSGEGKKKKKKKKRKGNKTAPISEDTENVQELPPLSAWGTPPGTLNDFPGNAGGRRLEPLASPRFSGSPFSGPSNQESDEDTKPLGPIRNKSWVRTRPNSEDHDVMT